MIPKANRPGARTPWQQAMAEAYTRPEALREALGLTAQQLPLAAGAAGFAFKVPRGYVARMRPGDPADPLLRQVWPAPAEQQTGPSLPRDAVGDLARLRGAGVIQKYHGRALLIATGACAIHCRYCFRRHFPYGEQLAARGGWREALGVLAEDASLEEVILSGGDPLSLTDDKLAAFIEGLNGLPHIRRLRLHSRQPIVLPERVDSGLIATLGRAKARVVMVVHANHVQELDASVAEALGGLARAGITLLNQSVLLRGVNDSVEALARLSEGLFECGVVPYYLHLLDRVPGVLHFDVPEPEAVMLLTALHARLPGYLVPRLVREIPGEPGKTLIPFSVAGP